MLRFLRNLLIVFAIVLGITFGFFNYEQVTVNLLWSDAQVPLVIVLVAAFLLGFGLALLFLVARLLGLRTNLSKTKKQLKDAQGEIRNLRSMPIHDA